MPIHSHDRAEGLKPKRMREPTQYFVASVVMHDRLDDDSSQRRHTRRQPRRHAPGVQGKISAAGSFRHARSVDVRCRASSVSARYPVMQRRLACTRSSAHLSIIEQQVLIERAEGTRRMTNLDLKHPKIRAGFK